MIYGADAGDQLSLTPLLLDAPRCHDWCAFLVPMVVALHTLSLSSICHPSVSEGCVQSQSGVQLFSLGSGCARLSHAMTSPLDPRLWSGPLQSADRATQLHSLLR